MPVLDHFSWIAPFYDRLAAPTDNSAWARLLKLPARGALLDAGGGTGRIAQSLQGKVDRVVVVDLSAKMLAQARGKTGLLPTLSEAESLPFADGTFSRVIMVDAMHHMRDQVSVARELFRVLEPGGRLVIQEPDLRLLSMRVVSLLEKLLLMRSHMQYPAGLIGLFAGFPAQLFMEAEGYSIRIIVDWNVQQIDLKI